MGVHTGDSITVAPALTLTDKEYQIMRSASIAVLREIGVETGGSNVQFAVNPKDGRLIVIEMNPRVSRSSALASKATGFPIARVAAKLAVGYTLDELTNEITGATPASFEPSIDYVVTKIPRFAFEKFKGAEPLLSTAMKSVGEVMAIGRNFKESMQKALRGLETGLDGFDEVAELVGAGRDAVIAALSRATPDRLLNAAQALREGFSVDDINQITHYDPWFLRQISEIIAAEATVIADGLPTDAAGLRSLKAMGFSDRRLATLAVRSVHVAGGLCDGRRFTDAGKKFRPARPERGLPAPVHAQARLQDGFPGGRGLRHRGNLRRVRAAGKEFGVRRRAAALQTLITLSSRTGRGNYAASGLPRRRNCSSSCKARTARPTPPR